MFLLRSALKTTAENTRQTTEAEIITTLRREVSNRVNINTCKGREPSNSFIMIARGIRMISLYVKCDPEKKTNT